MIMIILHHIWVRTGGRPSFLSFLCLDRWGYMGTGVFLFLSGFGLFTKFEHQKPTIEWLIKKLAVLCFTYICVFGIDIALFSTIKPGVLSSQRVVDLLTLSLPYSKKTWFLRVIICTYVIGFFVFRLKGSSILKVSLLIAITVLYFIIAKVLLPDYWWSSILNYPLGVLIAYKKEWLPHRASICFLSTFLVWVLIWSLFGSLRVLVSLSTTLLLIVAASFIDFHSSFLEYVGKHSMPFYLFQDTCLTFFMYIFTGWLKYGVCVFLGTFVLSILYIEIVAKRLMKINV